MKKLTELIGLVFLSVPLLGATIYTDPGAFATNTSVIGTADFEDVAIGTLAPIISRGVTIGTGTVTADAVSLPHSFWFNNAGSSPNWVVDLLGNVTAAFPSDVTAFGLLFTCFACDLLPDDASMHWTLLSSASVVVDSGAQVYDFSGFPYDTTFFLGVHATTPFRSVQVGRFNVSTGQLSGSVWFADDIQFGAATLVPQPPSIVLTSAGALFLLATSWIGSVRRRRN